MGHHLSTLAEASDSVTVGSETGEKHRVALVRQLCTRNYNGVSQSQSLTSALNNKLISFQALLA